MTKTNLLVRDEHAGRLGPVRYELGMAGSPAEIRAAQLLRERVFAGEWGAITPGPVGIDRDEWDDIADHLLIHAKDDATGRSEVVATYRLVPPHAHTAFPRERSLCLNTEFDIGNWAPLLRSTVEAGRACVAPEHRTATPIALLWAGIARYMHLTGYRYLAGAASISLSDGGAQAAAFHQVAEMKYRAPAEWTCIPRRPFSTVATPAGRPQVPPLLTGYLRLGAKICGHPAVDPNFNTADFPILLDLHHVDQRYLERFLQISARA